MTEKKYQKIIDKILSKSDRFELAMQQREDVKEYFSKEMKCNFLPKGFVEFMQVFDGITVEGFSIFAIDDKDKVQMTYEKYSTEKAVDKFMEDYKMKSTNSKLFFFATDNRGGRYAFKKDIADDRIYYFEKYNPDGLIAYSNFEDLLEQKIENHLSSQN